jgi:hypothetical protein
VSESETQLIPVAGIHAVNAPLSNFKYARATVCRRIERAAVETPILLPIRIANTRAKRAKIVLLALVGAIGIDIEGGRIRGYYAHVSEL